MWRFCGGDKEHGLCSGTRGIKQPVQQGDVRMETNQTSHHFELLVGRKRLGREEVRLPILCYYFVPPIVPSCESGDHRGGEVCRRSRARHFDRSAQRLEQMCERMLFRPGGISRFSSGAKAGPCCFSVGCHNPSTTVRPISRYSCPDLAADTSSGTSGRNVFGRPLPFSRCTTNVASRTCTNSVSTSSCSFRPISNDEIVLSPVSRHSCATNDGSPRRPRSRAMPSAAKSSGCIVCACWIPRWPLQALS